MWPLYCLSFLDLRLLITPLVSCGHCIFCHSSILYCLSFLDFRLMITPLVSFGHCVVCTSSIYDLWLSFLVSCGHCIVCPSSIYDFWLPLWYLVAVVLSVLPRLTNSDYPFGILWPLYFLSFLDLRLLITPLVSFGHCVVCTSSIYDLWLSFWYLVAIVMSVLPRFTTSDYSFGILWPFYCLSFLGFTTSDYPFGFLWPLYCLSFLDLRLLITPLVSCDHCIVCPSSIYDFWLPLWYLVAIVFSVILRFCIVCHSSIFDLWLPLWYLLAIVLSVLPRYTIYDYPFGILWPLYCLSVLDLRLLITPLVSCGRCIVCPSSINEFWLPLWYLVAIVFSFVPRFTTSDYPSGIFWPLCCLYFLDLRLMIILLVSCGHCNVCPSSIYDFWLLLWYLVAILLSVLPRVTTSDYPFGFFEERKWPFYCLSFLDLRLLITLLVSCGHCIVCPSSIYDFWLPLLYLLAIVLSFPPRFTTSDYPFGILWPLYCLSFLDLRLLITPLVSCGHCIFVLPRFTISDYPFGILWPLYFLSFFDFALSVIPRFSTSDYPFGIFWTLCCLYFLDIRFMIILLVSCGHCIVCSSSIYDFWLPLWYLVAVVLSVFPRLTNSDYPFGILWPLYFLLFLDLRLLITPLVSFGHCVVCTSSIYDLWLSFWYLVAIVMSVLPRFTTSDYSFGILWPFYCLSFLRLRLLITPLVSCGHSIVSPSSIYDFCLPFWYLVAIVLSVLPRFTTSDYPFCILWPLYCLSLLDLRLLITPLVSCGRYIVCPSSVYDFWLPLWYLVAIVFSSFLDLRFLITPLVSCGHCIVCPSSIYDVWLPLWYVEAIVLSVIPRFCIVCHSSICDFWLSPWYLVAIVLSVLPRFCIFCHSSICDFWLSFWYLVAIVLSVIPRFCIVCHSSICDFWLPFWYLVAIALSVLPRSTTSDYPFGIFWPLYCLSFLDLRLLITPLVSCDHCIVCPSSIYDFWLPLWYLLAIVLSVLPRSTTSDYPFGIFWPLYCLSFLDLRLLITHLVFCGHCIVFPSSSYDFWLPFWYLVTIVLSVLPRFTTSDIPFGIFWPLYCLSFLDLRLLITPLVSCDHCIVCPSSIYDFWLPLWYLVAIVFSVILRFCIVCHSSIFDLWLPLWYLLAIVLSVLPRYTIYDYPFGILWPLYCLSVLDLRLLITPLVSCGRCIVCPSSINEFWLPLWYLVAIVFSFVPRFTTSDYPSGIFWPLCCLYFLDLRLMIILLVSCGHCNVCPSSIYDFWLLLWYLVAILLSVLPRVTTSDYPFGFLWPLYCLYFLDLRLLITPLVSCDHCIVCPSSIYDFWLPLWYLVAIVFSVILRFCIVCHSSIFDLWLPLWYLLAIVLSVLPRYTIYDYPFGILWPLYCLSVLNLRLLITPLVSCGRCIVCPSSINEFWLPLWYLVAIVFSFVPRFTTSDYPSGIFWPLCCLYFLDLRLMIILLVSCGHCIVCHSSILYCLSFLDLRLLITLLVSCGHCIVCPSSIYDFWLPLWYLLAIVLSVLPRFTTFDYPFGILWPLYCLSFLDLRLLITPLVSFGHCIVCPSSIYDFWLPLWYLLAIVLSVLPRSTTSDYPFGILWPLYCISFLELWLLITLLVSCDHCIVCPSSIYDFWYPLWYLLAIVLSVLPRFTTSDNPFGILWPLYCLSFLDLRLLITPLVSCGHCIFCHSSILYCLSFLDFRLMITPLVSFGHCVVCTSSIYDLWLSFWYLVAIVLSVRPRFTTSDYPFGILWPLYCLSFLD